MTTYSPETLTRLGYRRVSNKYGVVARIDREDFVEVLARALRRAPADFYVPGGTDRVAGNWCDHYRRVHSKDRIELPREVARLVPSSCHDSTGFVKPPKPVVESTPGTESGWVEGMFGGKSRTGPEKTNLNMGDPFGWPLDKFRTGGMVSDRASVKGQKVRTPKPFQRSALEELARRDQMTRVTFTTPRRINKFLLADPPWDGGGIKDHLDRSIKDHLDQSLGIVAKRIKPAATTTTELGADVERAALTLKRLRSSLEGAMADAFVSLVIASLQREIDEEGCGPVMAALKSWKD